jgi:hypothetical protein
MILRARTYCAFNIQPDASRPFWRRLCGTAGLLLLGAIQVVAQTDSLPAAQGAWARLEIVAGDSTFAMSLRPVKVSAKRTFKDLQEQRQYYLYKRAAKKVYPYALQALELYSEISGETAEMNKRQRRRFIRNEHKELKEDFQDQLKNLSKTEGKVLIKMLEKELNQPFYEVLKETRGTTTAVYWHNLGKIWGYNLKDGYRTGADTLLDEVLLDYDFGRPAW